MVCVYSLPIPLERSSKEVMIDGDNNLILKDNWVEKMSEAYGPVCDHRFEGGSDTLIPRICVSR